MNIKINEHSKQNKYQQEYIFDMMKYVPVDKPLYQWIEYIIAANARAIAVC